MLDDIGFVLERVEGAGEGARKGEGIGDFDKIENCFKISWTRMSIHANGLVIRGCKRGYTYLKFVCFSENVNTKQQQKMKHVAVGVSLVISQEDNNFFFFCFCLFHLFVELFV